MAVTVVLTDVTLLLNAISYEAQLVKAELPLSVVALDATVFGGSGWTSATGGLKSAKLSCDFNNDYTATTGLNTILFGFFGSTTTFELRPTSAARSTSNPGYTGTVLIDDLKPIAGKVGDIAVQSLSWTISGPVTQAFS